MDVSVVNVGLIELDDVGMVKSFENSELRLKQLYFLSDGFSEQRLDRVALVWV